jgi:hypothetical protein
MKEVCSALFGSTNDRLETWAAQSEIFGPHTTAAAPGYDLVKFAMLRVPPISVGSTTKSLAESRAARMNLDRGLPMGTGA